MVLARILLLVSLGMSHAEPPSPPPAGAERARGAAAPIDDALRAKMVGVTHKEGCPVPLADLRALSIPYRAMSGGRAEGLLIIHKDHAEAILDVFAALYAADFRVQSIRPAHEYGGDDGKMMAANNTSGFNCRPVGGSGRWSEHAYGLAIDLNPLINPYVRGERVDPPGGRAYLDRDAGVPGLVVAEGPAVRAFREAGWKWGGFWKSAKDYQHFSATGR